MTLTEQPAASSDQAGPRPGPAAVAVVLLVAALAGLLLLIFAFSTTNADFSIDGDTATTSSYTGADQAP